MDGELPGALWIAGVTISLFVLLVGLGRLAWIASRAQRVVRGPWTELAREIASRYSLRRPVLLLQSDHPTMLVTWGLVRPRVILPRSARDWPEDRARVVLAQSLRTSAAGTGRFRWRRRSFDPSTGSIRSCGSRAGVYVRTASRRVTTRC